MNKRLLFISAALLLAFGCAKETDQRGGQSLVKVGASLGDVCTRTYLDEAAIDGKRQVCWSEGDAINLNGYASLPLTAEQAGKPVADFFFYNGAAPLSIIYPASVCEGSKYAEDGSIDIDIPSVQEYSSTSFGKNAAVLYGYGETQPVALNNLCGAVRVTIKGQQTVITKAALISNDRTAAVAGKYSLNPQTGAYTVLDGIHSVALDITEITLTEQGQSFYFTMPYGEYPEGFTVKFYNAEGYPMECVWLKNGQEAEGVTIEAGKLYDFKPVDFVPGKKEILTGADWNYVATQINEGKDDWKATYLDEKTNTLKLGDDIILDKDAVSIKSLEYTIDGNGFSVTNQAASKELVTNLPEGGKIMDLTLKGKMVSGTDMAALVHTVAGGTIENCVNEMSVELTSRYVLFGVFARKFSSGMIKGCVNKADFNIILDISAESKTLKAFCGGLVATIYRTKSESPSEIAIIEDCINEGDIKIAMKLPALYSYSRAGFGGIVGYINDERGSEDICLIKNCINRGDLSLDITEKVAGKEPMVQTSVGGILGLASSLVTSVDGSTTQDYCKIDDPKSATKNSSICIEGCSNEGVISNNVISRCTSTDIFTKVFTGGIAGTVIGRPDKHSVIKNCVSKGAVLPYSIKINPFGRAGLCTVCGGVIGLGGYVDVTGGTVEASVGTPDALTFAVGGVIGTAIAKFSISGMSISPKISHSYSLDHAADNHALAVVNSTAKIGTTTDISGSSVTGCSFGGSFFTASTAKYTDVAPYPERIVSVTAEDIAINKYIVSASYTKGDITISDNVFAGVNAQEE